MQVFFHQQYVIACPLSVGFKIPQALDFKPSNPKVLGWFHVAAGYHIIGDYAVGHWVLRWFHGHLCLIQEMTKVVEKQQFDSMKYVCVYTYVYIYILYIYLYILQHRFTVTQFKRFRENIPRMQKFLRYLLVGEVSVECIQIWWTSQIKGG